MSKGLFKVRYKNSKTMYEVYFIDESDMGDIVFLAYNTAEQSWEWILADNCIPS